MAQTCRRTKEACASASSCKLLHGGGRCLTIYFARLFGPALELWKQGTQLHPRLVQLRFAIADGAAEHFCDLIVFVAFYFVQDNNYPVSGWEIRNGAF